MSTFAQYMNRLPRVSAWVMVAMAVAMVLAGYYGLMGFRYLNASEQESVLSFEVGRLLSLGGRTPLGVSIQTAQLEASQQRQAELGEFFTNTETDSLIAVLSAAAQETSVDLSSVSVGETRTEVDGDMQYKVQPLAVILQGDAQDIFSFFEILHQRLPSATVTGVRIASLDSQPSARAQILVSTSPETLSEEALQQRAKVAPPKQRIEP